MKRLVLLATLLATAAVVLPTSSAQTPSVADWRRIAVNAVWDQLGDAALPKPPVPSPTNRFAGWAPQPAGTTQTIDLDYGPYVVTPGADLSRIDITPAGADGYATEVHTFVIGQDGEKLPGDMLHTHHVHLLRLNPDNPQYFDWLTGTGEEMTGGSIGERALADPAYKGGLRYGLPVQQGEQLGVLSMLHNMSPETHVVYIRYRLRFVYGTHDAIKQAKGWDFHALTPQIFGGTFNVPRTRDKYTWPLQLGRVRNTPDNRGTLTSNPTPARMVPGQGVVWTAPYSGTIVIAAGHLHAGGTDTVLSNLGSVANPCPHRGMARYPGTTLLNSRVIGHHGVWPSNDYQMGLSQYRWRAYVHKGDRIAVNGSYLTQRYAYPDAMVFAGLYIDRSAQPPAGSGCAPFLDGDPGASLKRVIRTHINHPWSMYPDQETCSHCDTPEPRPAPGPATNIVNIVGMQYQPGNGGTSGMPIGPPVVTRGQALTFVNEDYAESLMRHTVTTCRAPCNGPGLTNNPFYDGRFDSGVLGYMIEDAYVSGETYPRWSLDTSHMRPGYYTYFCRLHPFMRGAFYVKRAA
jgi:plastocyanin